MAIGGALSELSVVLKLKDEMSGPLNTAVSGASGVAGKLQALAPAGMAAGAALTGVGVAAVSLIDGAKASGAANQTMALSFGESTAAVKAMNRSLQSVDTPMEDVQGSMDLLARSGVSLADAGNTIQPAFDTLADAMGITTTQMTDAMIPAFNAMGIPLTDAPNQIDGLATMFRNSKVDVSDFSAVMTKVGPDLGALGLDLTDVEGIMAAFADRGITGRKATTMLTAAIKDASAPAEDYAGQLEKAKTEGVDLADKMAIAQAKVGELTEKMGNSKTATAANAAALERAKHQVSGLATEIKNNADAQAGLASASSSSATSTEKFYGALGLTAGEMAKYKTETENSTGAAQKFADAGNSQFGTMDKIGFAFTEVKQKITDAITPFEGVASAALLAGPALTGISGAADLLGNKTVQNLIPGLSGAAAALGGGGGLMGAASGAGGALAALATGPIGLAVIAIAAIVAGVILLDQKFHFIGPTIEWISSAFQGIAAFLGDTFGPIIGGIIAWFGDLFTSINDGKDPMLSILQAFKDFGTWAAAAGKKLGEELGPAIKEAATWIGTNLGPVLKDAVLWLMKFGDKVQFLVNPIGAMIYALQHSGDILKWLSGVFKTFTDWLGSVFVDAVKTRVGILITVWDAVKSAIGSAWEWITNTIDAAWKGITDLFTGAANNPVVKAVGAIWVAISGAVGAAWNLVKTAVSKAVDGIRTWIEGQVTNYVTSVALIWKAIAGGVKSAWTFVSAAVVTAVDGIRKWIETQVTNYVNSVALIWSAIAGAVSAAWTPISTAVSLAMDTVRNWIETQVMPYVKSVAAIWTGIQNAIPAAWELIKTAISTAFGLVLTWIGTQVKPFVDKIGEIWTGIQNAVGPAWTLITSAITGAIGLLKTAMDIALGPVRTLVDWVSGAISTVQNGIATITSAGNTAQQYQNTVTAAQTPTASNQPASGSTTGVTLDSTTRGEVSVTTNSGKTLNIAGPPRREEFPSGTDGEGAYREAYAMWDAMRVNIKSHHTGGTYRAPGGNQEGLALLLSGERVLSPAQTNDYDSGLLNAVKQLTAMVQRIGASGQGKDINVTIQSDIPATVQRIDQYNAGRNQQMGYRGAI